MAGHRAAILFNRDLFKFLKHERLQILHISKELLKEEQKLADEENTKEIQNKLNEINNQISSLNYVASALENVNIELSELSVDNEDQKIRFIAGESDAGKLLDNLTLSFSTGDNLLSIGGDGRNASVLPVSEVFAKAAHFSNCKISLYGFV